MERIYNGPSKNSKNLANLSTSYISFKFAGSLRLLTHLAACLILTAEKLWWKRGCNLLCTSRNCLTLTRRVTVLQQVCKTCFGEIGFRVFLSIREYSWSGRWLPGNSCPPATWHMALSTQTGFVLHLPPVPLVCGNQHTGP